VINKAIAKLLAAGFIKKVFHPEWLANPIRVKKKNNNEWRMCVNDTDLNKHCLKDPFGLPRIDQVIDSTLAVYYFASLIAIQATIRLPPRKKTRSRLLS
jgi:hypothetical protein